MTRVNTPVTVLKSLALLVSLTAALPGCRHNKGVDRDREAQRVIVDTGEACVRVGDGQPAQWAEGTYISREWQELQKLARLGDAQAGCDAAKLMRKHYKQTRTCTKRVIDALSTYACT